MQKRTSFGRKNFPFFEQQVVVVHLISVSKESYQVSIVETSETIS